MIATLTVVMRNRPDSVAVSRIGDDVRVTLGSALFVMTIDELRALVNEGADVLDVWFTEREQGVK